MGDFQSLVSGSNPGSRSRKESVMAGKRIKWEQSTPLMNTLRDAGLVVVDLDCFIMYDGKCMFCEHKRSFGSLISRDQLKTFKNWELHYKDDPFYFGFHYRSVECQ